MEKSASIVDKVIDGGFCIGCGACASISGSPYKTSLDDFGCYVARRVDNADQSIERSCEQVCPFSSKAGLRVRFFFCARWCAMGCSLGGKREKRARTTRMRASAKNLVAMCVCTE